MRGWSQGHRLGSPLRNDRELVKWAASCGNRLTETKKAVNRVGGSRAYPFESVGGSA
jgi:hypothetical protein